MIDWGHEGHVGPRKTYYTLTRAREADNGVLVAPRGPKARKPQFSATPWGHVMANWGHVQPVAHLWTEKVSTGPAGWALVLARLDASRPISGMDPDRWQYLLADAQWLCQQHGETAHSLGWNAHDLFEIGAAPGWGGLADRLEGARNVVLTDRIAHWRGPDLEGWLWRETMRPMPLIWEIAR